MNSAKVHWCISTHIFLLLLLFSHSKQINTAMVLLNLVRTMVTVFGILLQYLQNAAAEKWCYEARDSSFNLTNATKTTTVLPIFPILTTAALNTKGINKVTLFSAERRMGMVLGWLSTKCSKWRSEEMIAFIWFKGFAVWFEVLSVWICRFIPAISLIPNRWKALIQSRNGPKSRKKAPFFCDKECRHGLKAASDS